MSGSTASWPRACARALVLAALLPAQSCLTALLWSDGILVHRETKLVGEEDCEVTSAATALFEERVVLVLEHRPVGGEARRTLLLEQPARPNGAELLLLLHAGRVPELPVALMQLEVNEHGGDTDLPGVAGLFGLRGRLVPGPGIRDLDRVDAQAWLREDGPMRATGHNARVTAVLEAFGERFRHPANREEDAGLWSPLGWMDAGGRRLDEDEVALRLAALDRTGVRPPRTFLVAEGRDLATNARLVTAVSLELLLLLPALRWIGEVEDHRYEYAERFLCRFVAADRVQAVRVPLELDALTFRYRRFETEGSIDVGQLALKVLLTPVALCGDLLFASLWLWVVSQDDDLDEQGWQRR